MLRDNIHHAGVHGPVLGHLIFQELHLLISLGGVLAGVIVIFLLELIELGYGSCELFGELLDAILAIALEFRVCGSADAHVYSLLCRLPIGIGLGALAEPKL